MKKYSKTLKCVSICETNEIYLLCIEETEACWHSFHNFGIQFLNN